MRYSLVIRCGLWVAIVAAAIGTLRPLRAAEGEAEVASGTVSEIAAEQSDNAVPSAFDHYVVRGGWITLCALIPLSVAALALIVENGVTIRRKTIVPPETVDRLAGYFERKQYAEAVQFSGGNRSVVGHVVHCGLMEARNGYAEMERAMEDALEERGARLSRKIEYLNLIGNVAPMLGLFGTVHGIIGMFISISEAGGIPVMSRISHNLGTALVATFWGLLIAIPSLTVFGLLRNRIDVLLGECAIAAERLMAAFRPSAMAAETPHTAPGYHMAAATVAR